MTGCTGVGAGAGDLRPGVVLGRDGGGGQRVTVALIGRAHCKVDASYGPVETGDLLTTSPTRGHAMLAADPARAFGAILGKALRPLSHGRATVPILVALL